MSKQDPLENLTFEVTTVNSDKIPDAALIILAMRLYLDPDHIAAYYQDHVTEIQQMSPDYYFLVLENLLQIGIKCLKIKHRIVFAVIALVSNLIENNSNIDEEKIIKVLELFYYHGIQIGLATVFKSPTMILIQRGCPKLYNYVLRHYSATVIQKIFRGWSNREPRASNL